VTTLFDRYVLGKFLHTYAILFVSTYGLFVVIDGFTNLDGFQEDASGPIQVVIDMLTRYLYQASSFFNMIGAILGVVSTMIVFALLQKHSEIHPMLAAGVPVFRLLLPALIGMAILNGLLIMNQELIIPHIAQELSAPRSKNKSLVRQVDPVLDTNTLVFIGKGELLVNQEQLKNAVFSLPMPKVADKHLGIKVESARYVHANERHQAGWLLEGLQPSVEEILPHITPAGHKIVKALPEGKGLFVTTSLSFLELTNPNQSSQYFSTVDLIRRLNIPNSNTLAQRKQKMLLHTRITAPLLNLLAIMVAIPLVLRKESRGLVGNLAICGLVLTALLAVMHGATYLGNSRLIEPDLAAWLPVVATGCSAAWVTGYIQT